MGLPLPGEKEPLKESKYDTLRNKRVSGEDVRASPSGENMLSFLFLSVRVLSTILSVWLALSGSSSPFRSFCVVVYVYGLSSQQSDYNLFSK